jgi:hypothetical protein
MAYTIDDMIRSIMIAIMRALSGPDSRFAYQKVRNK